MFALAILAIAWTAAGAGPASAEMYKWADRNGAVHFTDTPPPAGAKALDLKPVRVNRVGSSGAAASGGGPTAAGGEAAAARAAPEGRDYPKVELYGTSWCPSCRKARAYLQGLGIPYDDYDVDKDESARRRYKGINPQGTVPTTVIGDQVLIGFSTEQYDAALRGGR